MRLLIGRRDRARVGSAAGMVGYGSTAPEQWRRRGDAWRSSNGCLPQIEGPALTRRGSLATKEAPRENLARPKARLSWQLAAVAARGEGG